MISIPHLSVTPCWQYCTWICNMLSVLLLSFSALVIDVVVTLAPCVLRSRWGAGGVGTHPQSFYMAALMATTYSSSLFSCLTRGWKWEGFNSLVSIMQSNVAALAISAMMCQSLCVRVCVCVHLHIWHKKRNHTHGYLLLKWPVYCWALYLLVYFTLY